ncbi:MAG: 2Fe-2S iron-sulfur cluster-binding protein [Syntrophales bacterium]|jgi:NADH dehydrogenase/NADH:ubiquinone oxidoreductase subunit G|nr:2Fe-2S iron-sulfur cluster-binding protein [Syntrophales bacterium]MCK9528310.1 2Fe-2S iron-sulfur cluster-binding protein [Syntrophales bacterium]MDX9922149.1 2Fe-2S iron-sulfur cluster-binding protein [Syntrophales bacterium]
MVTIHIDGRTVKAAEGTTVLQQARELNIPIPTLCHNENLSPFGACRLCTVEVKTNGKWQLAASCTTPVNEGMEIRTGSEAIAENRKLAASLLYRKYPGTEAVRAMAASLGVEVPREEGTDHDCILCGLCVRACREIVGVSALTFEDRGLNRAIDEPAIIFDPRACIGCGSCVVVCPTGYVKMEEDGDRRIIWNKVFKMVPCAECGRYFAPEEQLAWISKKTGVPFTELTTCTSCR